MAAKQSKESCVYCGAKTSQESFCPKCRQPTPNITARERILWELGQWRTSHEGDPAAPQPVVGMAPPLPADPIIAEAPVHQVSFARETRSASASVAPDQPARVSEAAVEVTPRPRLHVAPDSARIHRVRRPGAAASRAETNGSHAMALEEQMAETVVTFSPPDPVESAAAIQEPKKKVDRPRKGPRAKRVQKVADPEGPRREAPKKPDRRAQVKVEHQVSQQKQTRVGFDLLPGEHVEFRMRGWSRLRPATLIVTSYRIVISRFPGRVKWIPLEEVRRARLLWRGVWSYVLEASVELITLQKLSRHKLAAMASAVDAGVGESRAPGNRRHDAGLLQEWCDRSMNVWDSEFGKLILFVKWHPVALLTLALFATAGIRAALL